MGNRIESLTLRTFRGATAPLEIKFDDHSPFVMIFGENGTGKSTIVDGIDFICNEQWGSLEDRSIAAGSKSQYLVSLGQNPERVKASLKYNGQTWTGGIKGKRPECQGPQKPPKVFVLRRSKILRLMDSQPRERYEAFKAFIDVPLCEGNEKVLRKVLNNNLRTFELTSNALMQSKSDLEALWRAEDRPGPGYLEWAQAKSKLDPHGLKTAIDKITEFLNLYSACGDKYKEFKKLEERKKSDEKIRDTAKDALFKNQLQVIKDAGNLIDVLKTAQAYFQQNQKSHHCPVCENEIDPTHINETIKERLEGMALHVRFKEDYENAQNRVDNTENLVNAIQDQFMLNVMALLSYFFENHIISIPSISSDQRVFWEKYSIENFKKISFERSFKVCKAMKPLKENLEKIREELNKTSHQWNTIKHHLNTINANEEKFKTLKRKTDKLTDLLQLLERERKNFVESVLSGLTETIGHLYEKIHPGEGYGHINFYLDPNRIGSIEITGKFQSAHDTLPQAYYSESHLDTLGICVFLALAHHYRDENSIIVLDDVLTSLDRSHMERFGNMLFEQADQFNQIIITTHYRSWYDRYKSMRDLSPNIQLIELRDWSMARGIQYSSQREESDETR
ncbi:MAG: AAA family ATPase [Candidatus Omnitrophota bacterium]